jgi:hypothetical protein
MRAQSLLVLVPCLPLLVLVCHFDVARLGGIGERCVKYVTLARNKCILMAPIGGS